MKAGLSRARSISIWRGWRSLQRARSRRRAGRYDQQTLRLFADAVRAGLNQPHRLLAYLQFLRDLGRVPPRAWLSRLLDRFDRLTSAQRQGVLRLVAESWPERLSTLALKRADLAGSPPGVAGSMPSDEDAPLSAVEAMQLHWRAEFCAWVQSHLHGRGICVVGNAASLGGQGWGNTIDAHGAVVRFNHFPQAAEHCRDVGRRVDVWVLSPGYRGPVPRAVKWVVMTGPDVRYTLRNWRLVVPLLECGARILTVPLPIWRRLVRELQAPPSAGLLLLAWLREMGGLQGWRGITAAGIGSGLSSTGAYHLGIRGHKADGRHHWSAESLLVMQWAAQGMGMIRVDTPQQAEVKPGQMPAQERS